MKATALIDWRQKYDAETTPARAAIDQIGSASSQVGSAA